MFHVSGSKLRRNLSRDPDEGVATRFPVGVTPHGGKGNVMMIAEEEFSGWQETVHLLSSPRNAVRLLRGLRQTEATSMDCGLSGFDGL